MYFKELIEALKLGEAGFIREEIGENPKISCGASIEKAQQGQISFLEPENVLINELETTNASAILLPMEENIINVAKSKNIAWAEFKYPKIAFAETLELLHPLGTSYRGIHPSAILGKNVSIADDISIGPYVCIGDNCKIDSGNTIQPGVVIYEGVQIGKDNNFHANCVIHKGTIIGNKCVIHSNAVIGSEGFGFIATPKGWRKMPQTGFVILEDKVEIGCNSAIDRPSVGETRIGSDTKIDNLVQIGHGVSIGNSCAMASQVGIAGGAKIGNKVILAGQVGVANRVTVGDSVIASSKCGIHTNIEPGEVISGFPAIPNKLWLRCSATFKKLPEIAKLIRSLDNKSN